MKRTVCTVFLPYGKREILRDGNRYFDRQSNYADIDREDGYLLPAMSTETEVDRTVVHAFTAEYFGMWPDDCNNQIRVVGKFLPPADWRDPVADVFAAR